MFDREDREVRERENVKSTEKKEGIYVFIIEYGMRDRKVERKKAFCIESILVYYRNKIFKSLPIKKRLSNHPCKKFSLLFSSHFGEIINDGPG